MPATPLSLLDLLPVASGVTPAEVIRGAAGLARHVEQLGFARYWVAEHHNMPSIASSAPEVLIAHVAALTSRIHVGAGGIMLPNHTPLRIVEIFRTLAALHPGRIDLGLGRAPGTDPVTSSALRRGAADDPNERLAEMLAFDRGGFPPNHPFAAVMAMPSDTRLPETWMLGSTLTGASIAAQLGLRYAFAGHFAMRHARAAIRHYRERFTPSAELTAPHAMLAITVVCGTDDAHARELAAPIRLAIAHSRTGKRLPIASVQEALAHTFTPEESAFADDFLHGAIVGGPERVRDELARIVDETGADELMLSGLMPDLSERMRSLDRVARVAGL
jgi:luciferase family oxidoreductase group 1